MELKEALRVQTHVEVKHQCHCTYGSEIGRQAAHKKTTKIHIFIHVLKVNINFQCKKNLSKKLPNSMTLYLY